VTRDPALDRQMAAIIATLVTSRKGVRALGVSAS